MADEPSLPQLPSSEESSSESKTRKRGHISTPSVADSSSDPAVFSSDDDPSLDNYVEGRRKRRYLGSWFQQRPVSSDEAIDDASMPPPPKRTLTRYPDSGVFLGSDGSDGSEGSDVPDPPQNPPRVRLLPSTQHISPTEQRVRDRIDACVHSGFQVVDIMGMGLVDISDEAVSMLEHVQCFPKVLRDVAFEQQDPHIHFFLGSNKLTRLPGAIFNLKHLTTLSLRNNQLTEIPPAIAKLTNLSELNLAQNRLRSVPAEVMKLLELGKLRRFFWAPNPLYEPDGELPLHGISVPRQASSSEPSVDKPRGYYRTRFLARSPVQVCDSMGKSMSPFKLPPLDVEGRVPLHRPSGATGRGDGPGARGRVASLVELCLRAGHASSQTAELHGYMPDELKHLRQLLQRAATQKAAGGLSCSRCGRLVVVPVVEWVEWHEMIHQDESVKKSHQVQSPTITFQHRACSWGCRPSDED